MGIEAWITSDGRAYFVRLHEFDGSEMGTSEDAEDGSQQVLRETFILKSYSLSVGCNRTIRAVDIRLTPVQAPKADPVGEARVSMTLKLPDGCKSNDESTQMS